MKQWKIFRKLKHPHQKRGGVRPVREIQPRPNPPPLLRPRSQSQRERRRMSHLARRRVPGNARLPLEQGPRGPTHRSQWTDALWPPRCWTCYKTNGCLGAWLGATTTHHGSKTCRLVNGKTSAPTQTHQQGRFRESCCDSTTKHTTTSDGYRDEQH